ncbi:MAG: ATP synthase subunit C [Anaerolineae bacterium]
METLFVMIPAMLILAMVGAAYQTRRAGNPRTTLKTVVGSLLSVNGLAVLGVLGVLLVNLVQPMPVLAQAATPTPAVGASNTAVGAALATGLACIGAGIAVGIAGAAAIGGITEKPEILGRTLIFVGLAEGIAIYGLIISFMILNQ